MTEEQIKEELSNNYIGALACYKGFLLTKPKDIGGVDFSLTRALTYTDPLGYKRFIQDGRHIEIQMKSTTWARVDDYPDAVGYNLESKTYNDLVYRNVNIRATPLILVLFVLPKETEKWIEVNDSSLMLRHSAYWYLPEKTAQWTNNVSSIKIKIPKENRFAVDTWPNLFNKFHP